MEGVTAYSLHSVLWSPQLSRFVAVGSQASTFQLLTSEDGIAWTPQAVPPVNFWRDIAWSPQLGLFVVIAKLGSASRLLTSPDGIVWTTQAVPFPAHHLNAVAWSPQLGLFAVVVSDVDAGSPGNLYRAMTSSDGVHWTAHMAPVSMWRSLVWSPELSLFVAVSSAGLDNFRIMTSPDGVHWIRRLANSCFWYSVVWSAELHLFVAVAFGGADTERVMTSSDGVVWESAEGIGSNQWLTVEWSPALGVFMAASFAAGPDQTMYSADGKTWTLQSTNTGARWWGLSWSPELGIFVAVGVSTPAGVHGIMTSSVACPTGTVWQTEGCVPPPCANGLEWLDNCLADACPAGYLWGNGTCELTVLSWPPLYRFWYHNPNTGRHVAMSDDTYTLDPLVCQSIQSTGTLSWVLWQVVRSGASVVPSQVQISSTCSLSLTVPVLGPGATIQYTLALQGALWDAQSQRFHLDVPLAAHTYSSGHSSIVPLATPSTPVVGGLETPWLQVEEPRTWWILEPPLVWERFNVSTMKFGCNHPGITAVRSVMEYQLTPVHFVHLRPSIASWIPVDCLDPNTDSPNTQIVEATPNGNTLLGENIYRFQFDFALQPQVLPPLKSSKLTTVLRETKPPPHHGGSGTGDGSGGNGNGSSPPSSENVTSASWKVYQPPPSTYGSWIWAVVSISAALLAFCVWRCMVCSLWYRQRPLPEDDPGNNQNSEEYELSLLPESKEDARNKGLSSRVNQFLLPPLTAAKRWPYRKPFPSFYSATPHAKTLDLQVPCIRLSPSSSTGSAISGATTPKSGDSSYLGRRIVPPITTTCSLGNDSSTCTYSVGQTLPGHRKERMVSVLLPVSRKRDHGSHLEPANPGLQVTSATAPDFRSPVRSHWFQVDKMWLRFWGPCDKRTLILLNSDKEPIRWFAKCSNPRFSFLRSGVILASERFPLCVSYQGSAETTSIGTPAEDRSVLQLHAFSTSGDIQEMDIQLQLIHAGSSTSGVHSSSENDSFCNKGVVNLRPNHPSQHP